MLDEAIQEIRGFCQRAGWECQDFSEHYSGVLMTTQPQVDGDPGAEEPPDPEPWPEMPKGWTGMRGRVSRHRPPPLIEETARGVVAIPPDTESLQFAFDSTGRLVHYMEFPSEMILNAIPDTTHYVAFPHFVKTTGAVESHVAICALMLLLREKYIKNLVVKDDTRFWGKWDFQRLEREHRQMGALVGMFQASSDLGGLLRKLGVDIPAGAKLKQLDPKIPVPKAKKKARKQTLN